MTNGSAPPPRPQHRTRDQHSPRVLGHALKGALARIWLATATLGRHVVEHASRDRETAELRRGLAEADEVAEALLGPAGEPLDEPPPLDVNTLLVRIEPTLRTTAGSSVRVHLRTTGGSGTASVEGPTLEAVIRQLVARAADAMPAGGELVISTGCVDFFSGSWPYDRFPPRRFVRVTLTDTALNSASDAWLRVLDRPTFPGALQLPCLAATVGQMRGYLGVEGADGEPSRIHLCLPAAVGAPAV